MPPLAVRVEIDARGAATVAIPDASGEERHYALGPSALGLDDRAWRLTRLDTRETHRVACRAGRWRCDCPAFRFRRGAAAPAGCKHSRAAAFLAAFLSALLPPP